MKKRFAFIGLLITLITLTSCENDIEINAPWVETPIVYGLLDANNNEQFLRIQKTYQNSVTQTTQQGAQYPDSLYFDSLQVEVTTPEGNRHVFTKVPVTKDMGFFTGEGHFVYKSDFKPVVNRRYNLRIFNPQSGKTYTSTTEILGEAGINTPNTNGGYELYIRPYNPFNFIRIRYQPALRSVITDLMIRLRYNEYPTGNPSLAVAKFIDYPVGVNLSANDPTTFNIRSNTLVDFYKNNLPNNPSVQRTFTRIDYVAIGGSFDLKLLIDLSQPTSAFVQRKPEYTNINGGLGIFSSRSVSVMENIPFRSTDIDSSRYYFLSPLPQFVF